ncbi:MAG: hypothetical protein IPL32_08425 [Chloracidobacterium sp.]|nr:hypothetical protein [Chloracidobacterium sp.]
MNLGERSRLRLRFDRIIVDNGVMGKYSTLVLAIVGGFLIVLFVWILSILFLFFTKYPQAVYVFILCLVLPFFCWLISRGNRDSWLAIALCASLPYILFTSYGFVGIVSENIQYENVFWNADYSPISFLLYLSVPVLSLLAAQLAANGRGADLLVLAAAFLFFVSLGLYSVFSVNSSIRESTVSVEFLDTPKIALSAQAYCSYTNYNLYWLFRRVENGTCECNRLIVQRRSPDIHLSSYLSPKILWNIDGVDEEFQIFPNGSIGLVVDKYGRPDEERNDWSNRIEWNTEVPYKKIVKAAHVTFTWGDVTQELSDEQRNSFSKIAENYERLK